MTTSPSLANESARRSAQNRAYAALALEHLDPADPRLAWLLPAGKPPRQKVLEELGRIAVLDQESCQAMAVELCARQPRSTHLGAAWLRHQRLGLHERGGDPKLLRSTGDSPSALAPPTAPSSTRCELTRTSGKPKGRRVLGCFALSAVISAGPLPSRCLAGLETVACSERAVSPVATGHSSRSCHLLCSLRRLIALRTAKTGSRAGRACLCWGGLAEVLGRPSIGVMPPRRRSPPRA